MSCSQFKSRGLSGLEGCKCCKQGANASVSNLASNLLAILSSFVDPEFTRPRESGEELDVVLTGGFVETSGGVAIDFDVKAVPRNAPESPGGGVRPGQAGAGGAILVLAWETLTTLAAREETLSLVSALSDAIPPLVKTARAVGERSCEECIERKVWTQSKPQSREAVTIRRRLG